jgi:hypothetical protein
MAAYCCCCVLLRRDADPLAESRESRAGGERKGGTLLACLEKMRCGPVRWNLLIRKLLKRRRRRVENDSAAVGSIRPVDPWWTVARWATWTRGWARTLPRGPQRAVGERCP